MLRRNSVIISALAAYLMAGAWVKAASAADQSPIPDTARSDSIAIPSQTMPPYPSDTSQPPPDTMIAEPEPYRPGVDTLLINAYRSTDSITGRKPSPTITMFKSVAFPGWGQYANRKYIKAGLVFAVESYVIYRAVELGIKASDWRTKWKNAPAELKSEYFRKYADFRDRRNTFLWYTALTVFLSMFDAYVDAHLAQFPKDAVSSKNIQVAFAPANIPGLSLQYRF